MALTLWHKQTQWNLLIIKDTFRTSRFLSFVREVGLFQRLIFFSVCIHEYFWLVLCWEVCLLSSVLYKRLHCISKHLGKHLLLKSSFSLTQRGDTDKTAISFMYIHTNIHTLWGLLTRHTDIPYVTPV